MLVGTYIRICLKIRDFLIKNLELPKEYFKTEILPSIKNTLIYLVKNEVI